MRVQACYPPSAGRRIRGSQMAHRPHAGVRMMNENARDLRSPVPAANILRTDQGHVIEVALPGLTREQIQVELKDGLLVLQHIGTTGEGDSGRYTRREFDLSGFRRTFRLPESADISQIEARFEAGILYLSIPARQPVVRPVTIR